MSKRNPTARGSLPRRRGLFPRLRDIRIRSKLALLLVVPIIALVALAGIRLADGIDTVISAGRLRALAGTMTAGANLVDRLQAERNSAATLLAGFADSNKAYRASVRRTDRAYRTFQQRRAAVPGMPHGLTTRLRPVDAGMSGLGHLRSQVGARHNISLSSTSFRYRSVIADLLDYQSDIVNYASDTRLTNQLRAVSALSAAKEYVAQEQTVVIRALSSPPYTPEQLSSFTATTTGYSNSLLSFGQWASASWQSLYAQTVAGRQVSAADIRETIVDQTDAGQRLDLSPAAWNAAMTGRLALMRQVESRALGDVVGGVSDFRATLVRQLVFESALLLLALILAITFALVVAQTMAWSLRRMREGVLRVAYEGLPQAVAQLREADVVGTLSPDEIANHLGDPVEVRGRDEIGQVSEAFNVVHREAVRVSAEQAILRASVSTMFVNLARRSQLLVDRLIGHLDRLEQGEEDPDRLAQLFQLDHLATRMRRNDENLLVLAGADSSRARREAAPLGDVLRAAQSEVEQYTRIEFGVVDRDVEVEAAAVNDVVHLLAELLDNATSFSAPDTPVVVDARRVGDRAIVQIEDRGIGMSADVLAELNQRLAEPPLVDVAVSRMMGLVVVGRLASRLGIRVEVRAGADRGTVADVILPSSVLVPLDRGVHALTAPTASLALEPPAAESRGPGRHLDGIPGVPYQPPGRESLADAANGYRQHTNGSSGLPQRAPAPPSPPPDEPRHDQPPVDEPPRRSLFEPVRPPVEPDQPPDADRPGTLPSRLASGFTPRGTEPDAGTGFGSHFDESGAPPDGALPRRASEPGASVADLWGPQSGTQASTAGGLPRRGGADRLSSDDTDRPGWPGAAGAAGAAEDEVTVETPQLAAGTRRSPEDFSDPGRIDSAASESTIDSDSGRNEIIPRNVDDTMELPIFREVESAWFRTSPSQPRTAPTATAPSAGGAAPEAARTETVRPGGRPLPTRTPRRPAEPAGSVPETSTEPGPSQPVESAPRRRPTERPSPGPLPTRQPAAEPRSPMPAAARVPSEGRPDIDPWQSAADKGWQAASALASAPPVDETTTAGLPKRRPMAQLVPGGVEPPTRDSGTGQQRSPEAVRGLLSAYHRGVQRGRSGAEPRVASGSGYKSTGDGAGEEQEA